jgi:putative flavoprotein involved in K+ transport
MVDSIAPRAALTILLVKGNSLDSADQAVVASLAALHRGASEDGVISLSPAGQIGGEHCVNHAQLAELHAARKADAARHVTVVAAAGDTGAAGEPCALIDALSGGIPTSFVPRKEVGLVASDPLVLSAGGTTLHANHSTGAWKRETAWAFPTATPAPASRHRAADSATSSAGPLTKVASRASNAPGRARRRRDRRPPDRLSGSGDRPFEVPRIPEFARNLDPAVVQMHSTDYRSPGAIPGGTMLVVGGGNTGFQIAEELASTRQVHLSVGTRQTPLPQRLLGRDLFWWLVKSCLLGRQSTRGWGEGCNTRTRSSARLPAGQSGVVSSFGPRAVEAAGRRSRSPTRARSWSTPLSGRRGTFSTAPGSRFPSRTREGRVQHRRGVTDTKGLYSCASILELGFRIALEVTAPERTQS